MFFVRLFLIAHGFFCLDSHTCTYVANTQHIAQFKWNGDTQGHALPNIDFLHNFHIVNATYKKINFFLKYTMFKYKWIRLKRKKIYSLARYKNIEFLFRFIFRQRGIRILQPCVYNELVNPMYQSTDIYNILIKMHSQWMHT